MRVGIGVRSEAYPEPPSHRNPLELRTEKVHREQAGNIGGQPLAGVEPGAPLVKISAFTKTKTQTEGVMTSLSLWLLTMCEALSYSGLRMILASVFHMRVSCNDQRATGYTQVAALSLQLGPKLNCPLYKLPSLPGRGSPSLPAKTISYSTASRVCDVIVSWVGVAEDAPGSLERTVPDPSAKQSAGSPPPPGCSPGEPLLLLQARACDGLQPVGRASRDGGAGGGRSLEAIEGEKRVSP